MQADRSDRIPQSVFHERLLSVYKVLVIREQECIRDGRNRSDIGAFLVKHRKRVLREQALKAARVFVDDAERTLGGAVVHVGVAARAGRVLAAATLLAEAASARRRSLAGSVRVLGLKIDPDRYRAHVASA